jgi:class 3 adenylate cyclase/tetratricopeptide (TPR) repeat protein
MLRDRATVEGERRTVTVLFVDAVGSTPLAERLGEEEMYGFMQGCTARMMEAVHAYEGHVASFTGDGLMAVFGAPIAHEESERRAVAAALEMQRSLEEYAGQVKARHMVECRFRVGLNTGPVVVGKVHEDLHMDFTAVGDTVNLAARMEQLADPGAVYLTGHTWRAARDFFECEPLGAVVAKGKAEPVSAYRALRERPARTRLEVSAERGLVPFVGRQRELSVLHGHLEEARSGRGQVVFVSGEAGMGKSRLLFEFRRSLGESVPWLEGHCISYGHNIAYHPLADVVKRAFGVEESDDETRLIGRVDQRTAGWLPVSQALVPYLKYLLAVDPGDPAVVAMDPRARRAGIFDALRALLLEESSGEELVVVVEDLHWVDELSEEALAALMDVVPHATILLVLTGRPGQTPSLGERASSNRLALDHLSEEAGRAVARSVLGVDAIPSEVQALIASKAEGNPFFIEEVTKSLVEMGVLARANGSYHLARPLSEIRIPVTIQGVILARIDRLESQAKGAIQLASVIGREFTGRLLERISDPEARLEHVLGELKALELIYQKAYFPELAYMFKHALTHDVAYSTLLAQRRKALHRTVGAAIEELYCDRLVEHYETLAHHYYAGEAWEQAFHYLTKAGEKAAAVYANADALEFYARALEVGEQLPAPDWSALVGVARRRGFVNFGIGHHQAAVADFDRMGEAARRLGDRSLEGMALAYRGAGQLLDHDFEPAEATLRAALAIGEEGYDEVTAHAALVLAFEFFAINRHAEAQPYLALLDRHEEKLDPFGQALWGWLGGRLATWAGRFDEALQKFDRGRPRASRVMTHLLIHRWCEAQALTGRGDYESALAELEETLATCERVGDGVTRMRIFNIVGWIYGDLGDPRRALEWNQRGVEASRTAAMPTPEVEMHSLLNVAENLLALGRTDEAEEYLRDVEAVVRHPDPKHRWAHWRYSQRFLLDAGQLWLERGDPARAIGYAEECLAMAEETGSRKHVAMARRLKGRALLAQGKLDPAEPELIAALKLTEEVGNPPQIWKSHAALGDLRAAQGRADQARQAYHDAVAVIDRVAAGLTDESLRATFLASDHVQRIREEAETPR